MTIEKAIEEVQFNMSRNGLGARAARRVKEAKKMAIQALKEIQQYRAIGTVEELKSMKENGAFTGIELAQLAAMQMRLKEYLAIGTIEEFKTLKEYKAKMEMQYLDDINNPLEPLKLSSALQSEILKYNYRKEHKPQDINLLDYTIMYALKHCLEEQTEETKET